MGLETLMQFYITPGQPFLLNLLVKKPANPATAQIQNTHAHAHMHKVRPRCPVFLHIGTIWKITHVFLGNASAEASW